MDGFKRSLNEIWMWIINFIDQTIYDFNTFKNTTHQIHGEELLSTYILYFISGMIVGVGISLVIVLIGKRR
jgi:hypothetical protein